MRKILILILFFIGCSDNYSSSKDEICMYWLRERSNAAEYRQTDEVKNIDSMFFKCGCDTLNIKRK